MVIPEQTCESSIQQDNVIKFLSSHKKYRIFGWEFGPTLLDHLYRVKGGNHPDYTKNGLILTYSIASVAAFVSLASTRRATVTAAVTLGIILLGIATTAAIDYQKTKRKDTDELIDQSELLRLLGETRQYWWWPWSSKISEVTLTESQKERAEKYSSYSFLYRVILVLFTSVLTHRLILFQHKHYESLRGGRMDKKDSKTISVEYNMGLDVMRSVSFLESVLLYQADLESALVSLGFSYNTLSELDKELSQVRRQNYSKEAMEMYDKRFSEVFGSKYRKLSLKYKDDEEGAKNLNSMKEIMAKLYETSKEKDNFRYILFSGIAFNLLYQNRERCADLINANVVAELRNLTTWRQTDLIYYRNKFLERAQEYLTSFRASLCKNEQLEKDFNELQEWYVGKYEENWHNKLIELNGRCNKNKELEAIKDEVDNLAKKSTEQFNVLRNVVGKKDEHSVKGEHSENFLSQLFSPIFKKDRNVETKEFDIQKKVSSSISEEDQRKSENIDRCFVLPILEYNYVMKIYKELLKRDDSAMRGSVKEFRNYIKVKKVEEFNIQNKIDSCSFKELQAKTEALKDFLFCQKNLNLWEKEIVEYIKDDRLMAKVILVQVLERYGKLLQEEFKKEKTWFKMVEEKIKKAEEERKKIEKEIKEMQKATEQASVRAEQEAQRAEQTGIVSAVFLEMVLDSDMNRELRRIILKSQIDIVKAVVQHVMKHDSSPEQILNAIIKEVQFNGDQVIKEGTIDVELIEGVVKLFEERLKSQSTNTFDNQEQTPLYSIALQEDKPKVAEFLKKKGANREEVSVDSVDQNGKTLLYYAAWEGLLEAVKFLVCKGADVHDEGTHGGKPIHTAAAAGHRNIVEFFLLNGININEANKSGYTPLHYAARHGQLEMVQFLIVNMANIHAQAQNGKTPLHFAASYGHLDTAKFLVEKGANINVEDNYKNTPESLAIAKNRQDIIEFFNVLLPTPNASLEGVSTCSGNTRLQK